MASGPWLTTGQEKRSTQWTSLLYDFVLKQPAQRTPGLFPCLCDQNIPRSTFQKQTCIVFHLKKHCLFFSNLILILLSCILIIFPLWFFFVPFSGCFFRRCLVYCVYVFFILCIHVSSSPGSFQSKQKCFRCCFLLMMRVAPAAWGMSLSLNRQNS